MTGTVTAFDEARGCGTVRADDGATYCFHCTAIADGTRTIEVGTAGDLRRGGRPSAAGRRPRPEKVRSRAPPAAAGSSLKGHPQLGEGVHQRGLRLAQAAGQPVDQRAEGVDGQPGLARFGGSAPGGAWPARRGPWRGSRSPPRPVSRAPGAAARHLGRIGLELGPVVRRSDRPADRPRAGPRGRRAASGVCRPLGRVVAGRDMATLGRQPNGKRGPPPPGHPGAPGRPGRPEASPVGGGRRLLRRPPRSFSGAGRAHTQPRTGGPRLDEG